MPLGALPVQALLAKSRVDAKQRVDAILTENLPRGLSRPIFYAVGGGWRVFARVHLASSAGSLQVVNGYAIDARDARAFAKTISRLSKREIAALPGIPASRIATLPAAALVMDRVLKALSLNGTNSLLPASSRRKALILGRVLLLGYRLSGSVPEILAGAILRIGTDTVRLEVSKAARVPDSEVVANRLKLVADAVGIRRTQIVEIV
jgi:hypothetical protein